MIAFHGKQETKDLYVSRVKAHRAADEIIKGRYWVGGKGCAVGCTIHSEDHGAYETELGIPRIIARLEDGIFEGLPNDKALDWPPQFLEAIPIGKDLSLVWPKFAVWLLGDPDHGVIRFAREKTKPHLLAVIEGYQRTVDGNPPSKEEWIKIHRAAYAAADAAYAAYAADADAADAAAYAAYAADADAAAAAAYAAAADAADAAAAYAAAAAAAAAAAYAAYAAYAAARREHRVIQSEKLLQLLKETK